MKPPFVSVITVCRNALDDLRVTEASVRQQTCKDFEWIIVDGDSTDGTKKHLKKLREDWIHYKSEPDQGIYDAMNKGLQMARGDWVWFMNAGDTFSDTSTISQLLTVPSLTEIAYGEVQIVDHDRVVIGLRSAITPHGLPNQLEKECFRHGMVVSHQAFVVKRSIAPPYKAPLYQLSADLDWMLSILENKRISVKLGILANVYRHGATMDHWYRSQYERFLVMTKHFGYTRTIKSHFLIALRRLRHGIRSSFWR